MRTMKLKNILIVVKDIEQSKRFYHDLFGLDVVLDNDGNVIFDGRTGAFRMNRSGADL